MVVQGIFQIRGIGEQSGYEGTPNSSVGLMIDDIDFSGQGGISSSFDMEQVEVHRGPQGSRMGANALAGMIYMRSKEPTEIFSGLSEVTLGSDGVRSIGLAFGGPFQENPDTKYRFSIRQDQNDGFEKISYLNRDDTTGQDEMTARLKLNHQLNENTDINLLIQKSDFEAMSDSWTTDGSLNTSQINQDLILKIPMPMELKSIMMPKHFPFRVSRVERVLTSL